METVARHTAGIGGLWQVPLMVVALGAFGYAVWKVSDPGPGPTAEQRAEVAGKYLELQKPEVAIEGLNALVRGEAGKLKPELEASVRLMLARAIEQVQRAEKISILENHAQIVEQTTMAQKLGLKLEGNDWRRLGRSLEALRKLDDSVAAYTEAGRLDGELAPMAWRRAAEIELLRENGEGSEKALGRYLTLKLPDEDRAWGLGEIAQLRLGEKKFAEARDLLGEILKLKVSPKVRGTTAYRYGLSAYEMKDDSEAERQLRLARQLLTVRDELDGNAAYLLGKIYEKRGKPEEALAFYQDVIWSHPDSEYLVPARAGRGLGRIAKEEEDAGMADLDWVSRQMEKAAVRAKHTGAVLESYESAEKILTGRGNHQGALELLSLQKALEENPPAGFWNRVSTAYEKRAGQVEEASRAVERGDEREQLEAAARQLRVRAGDAALSYSRALTVADDNGYGAALWRAVEMYDNAGAIGPAVAALERFTQEKPGDTLAPEATLRLGKAYMAAGQFEKAIATFERARFRYPQSWAANQAAVPLAQALIAGGETGYGRAEKVLRELVEENRALTPGAEEFRRALFELGQLYYRQEKYEEAIARFDEGLKRYPNEPENMGQALFLMADSYRKSAQLLGERGQKASEKAVEGQVTEAEAARRERLGKAMGLYDRLVSYYRANRPTTDLAKSQQRLAHFYRADCAFDLGKYDEAIRLYDQAAFRYQDDASALAAYVQIVNANVALGKVTEAKSANERAKVLLKRMPPSAFSDGSFSLPRPYWERWLKWAGT